MAKKSGPQKQRRATLTPVWLSVIFALLVIVSLPTVMVLFFGMLPTIVAYIVDRTEEKYSTFCVGGMNFSGVFDYLLDLWGGRHSLSGAVDVLTDVWALLVMYGSASFGWLVFNIVPPLVAAILTVMAQRRVAQLRTMQRQLIEEWGEEVANPGGMPTGGTSASSGFMPHSPTDAASEPAT